MCELSLRINKCHCNTHFLQGRIQLNRIPITGRLHLPLLLNIILYMCIAHLRIIYLPILIITHCQTHFLLPRRVKVIIQWCRVLQCPRLCGEWLQHLLMRIIRTQPILDITHPDIFQCQSLSQLRHCPVRLRPAFLLEIHLFREWTHIPPIKEDRSWIWTLWWIITSRIATGSSPRSELDLLEMGSTLQSARLSTRKLMMSTLQIL